MLWSQLSNKLGYCIFRNDFLILFNNLNIFLVNSKSFIQVRVQKKYFFEFAAVATSRPILDNERRPLTFGHINNNFGCVDDEMDTQPQWRIKERAEARGPAKM